MNSLLRRNELFEEILAGPPQPHLFEGLPHLWGLGERALRFLFDSVPFGAQTLETGAGVSTVVFALAGAQHLAVTPSDHEAAALRAYCETKDVGIDRVTFQIDSSEAFLPKFAQGEHSLDVVLIDGRHGFPAPFIDWFYTAQSLKLGGLLLVDDCQLWTGRTLCDFLAEEAGWALERQLDKTVAFRKVGQFHAGSEWNDQPFVLNRSDS